MKLKCTRSYKKIKIDGICVLIIIEKYHFILNVIQTINQISKKKYLKNVDGFKNYKSKNMNNYTIRLQTKFL